MLLDHCYAFGLSLLPSGLKKKFVEEGPPMTYFGPSLDPPLDGSGRQITTLVRDYEYFIPSKSNQNQSSGSGEEVENVKTFTDGHGTTDDNGRTTDGAL